MTFQNKYMKVKYPVSKLLLLLVLPADMYVLVLNYTPYKQATITALRQNISLSSAGPEIANT